MDTPLTQQERRTAIAAIAERDPDLADRVASALQQGDDPMVSLLRTLIAQQTAAISDSTQTVTRELGALRWWVLGIVVIALGLNAALVGVSLRLDRESLTVTPASSSSPQGRGTSPAQFEED